jgi:hypothetical protein
MEHGRRRIVFGLKRSSAETEMAQNQNLPEGTDTIVTDIDAGFGVEPGTGGSDGGDESFAAAEEQPAAPAAESAPAGSVKEVATERAGEIKAQAADKARFYAEQGKDRATSALDSVAKLVSDAADTVDDRVGEQYGVYARRAADAVAGAAESLRSKDVDELFADARELVRKSPAIAIGAAAALGFIVARLARSTVPPAAAEEPSAPAANDVAFTPDEGTFPATGGGER